MKSPLFRIFSLTAFSLLAFYPPLAAQTTSGVTTLYSFPSGTLDGSNPIGGLAQDAQGNFYGTTEAGGTSGGGPMFTGTVFMMTPAGVVTTLHSFTGNGTDGQDPNGGLILGADGNLYGTTSAGATYGAGTVFRVTPAGETTTLHVFTGLGTDGAGPYGSLVQGSDGKFYGTTVGGGSAGSGTIFTVTPDGTFATLHSFSAISGPGNGANLDGLHPDAGLTLGSDGNFYGVTPEGGSGSSGLVFKITPDGTLTVLHAFTGTDSEGAVPHGRLVQAGDGNFYGTTAGGGAFYYGTIFRITPAGTLTTLHSFAQSAPEGTNPMTALVVGTDGALYGTTALGSAVQGGVFQITTGGDFAALHGFTGTDTDGARPESPVLLGHDGYLYGMTFAGGTSGAGTIFRLPVPATTGAEPDVVSIAVGGDGEAVEGGKNGKVLVTRAGDLTRELTVSYKAKGTAKAGVDYQTLPGTVTIPAGAAKAKIKVKPIAASPDHGTLKVKFVLNPAPDGSYTLGSAVKAKIVLREQN